MKCSLFGKLEAFDAQVTTNRESVPDITVEVDLVGLLGIQISKDLLGLVTIFYTKDFIDFCDTVSRDCLNG